MQDNTAKRFEHAVESPATGVRVEGNLARVVTEDGSLELPIMPLPEKFADWIEHGRRGMYDKLLGKGSPGFFTSHLPVMSTFAKDKPFPYNCSNKGVGFLPKPEYLEHFKDLFRRTLENTRGRPWRESLKERIAAVSSFYFDREKIDFRALSTLEIFEKGTYRNLSRTPLAALHYTGNAPDYVSFQLNCAVEIVKPDDPRHEFVHLARIMFEYDSFHIAQTNFPYAYVLWISEVLDKTPFRVPAKGNVITLTKVGDMEWEPAAIESINRAPGMIRQFITESIEKYARDRGFTKVTMDLVREAREVIERSPPEERGAEDGTGRKPSEEAAPGRKPSGGAGPAGAAIPAYSRIYVGLDSSGPADEAMALALDMGAKFGASMAGVHVYAARMHDNRFRAMEGGLPAEFQKEKELERQRKIHDSLITKGLELITDSYLEGMAKACAERNLPFTAVSLDGKNWKAMAEDIAAHDYDLVALGGHGIGRVSHSQLGTVAERLIRRVRRDVLLCKVPAEKNGSGEILVCLDGSERSWGGLMRALQLAKAFGKKVTAVSAFDPYFHYAMFKSLNRTLTDKARKVFKFEEQEKLHEDIIDSGLAKIYQSYLNIAKRMASDEGTEIETILLDGKPFEKVLQRVRKSPPWLLVMGRIGFHSDEDMDIGGNTENLCRLAPCNILVVDAKARPPAAFQADETVSWTDEAKARLSRIPDMAKGMAMKAIQNYCIAEGHTVVTESILDAAVRTILPPEALERMGFGAKPADAADASAAAKPSAESGESHDRIALGFKCQACGHVHHGSRPRQCPICGMGGHMFKLVESATVEDGQVLATLGDRQLIWDKSALAALDAVPDSILRAQVRNALEKRALTQRLSSIPLEAVQAEMRAVGLDAAAPTPGPRSPAAPSPRASAAPGSAATADTPKASSSADFTEPPGASPAATLTWTDDARKRLERVPEGFMRKAAQGMVEEHARSLGLPEITLDIAEAGLTKAREKMHATHAHSTGASAPAPHHAHAVAPPAEPMAKGPASWECHLCGLVVDAAGDSRPATCAVCGAGHFHRLSPEARAKAHPSALRPLVWEPAAMERLHRVPEGFMRDMTRYRVEKWARAAGAERVHLDVLEGKYGSWEEGSGRMTLELPWSDEARERAERIPDFIRPMVMKEIERRAKSAGKARVEADDMDQAMRHWSSTGGFHGHS
jgi:nucleotide-binding universal stress UspA family protein/rubrerythrin